MFPFGKKHLISHVQRDIGKNCLESGESRGILAKIYIFSLHMILIGYWSLQLGCLSLLIFMISSCDTNLLFHRLIILLFIEIQLWLFLSICPLQQWNFSHGILLFWVIELNERAPNPLLCSLSLKHTHTDTISLSLIHTHRERNEYYKVLIL